MAKYLYINKATYQYWLDIEASGMLRNFNRDESIDFQFTETYINGKIY